MTTACSFSDSDQDVFSCLVAEELIDPVIEERMTFPEHEMASVALFHSGTRPGLR
jgi:hypothetical protein